VYSFVNGSPVVVKLTHVLFYLGERPWNASWNDDSRNFVCEYGVV